MAAVVVVQTMDEKREKNATNATNYQAMEDRNFEQLQCVNETIKQELILYIL